MARFLEICWQMFTHSQRPQQLFCHLICETSVHCSTKKLQFYRGRSPSFKVEKGSYMHMSSFCLCASWLMFLSVDFFLKKKMIFEDITPFEVSISQQGFCNIHPWRTEFCCGQLFWKLSNRMISICPPRWGLRTMQLSRNALVKRLFLNETGQPEKAWNLIMMIITYLSYQKQFHKMVSF